MGLLDRAIKNGIGKGIRDAVGKATENIVAPKAQEYAQKLAGAFDNASKGIDDAAVNTENEKPKSEAISSLEASLNRLSQSAEKYADVMEKAAASQENLTAMWNEKLSGFPVWCFGGTDFWIDQPGKLDNGDPYYVFNAENTTQEGLDMYIALLKQNGFVRKYPTADEVLYKDLGGEYLICGTTDAFGAAPVMSLNMCRTTDRKEIEC